MDDQNEKLKQFLVFCREKRLSKAIIKGIPYVGPIFEELIYGDDLNNLIHHFHSETLENQKAILTSISELMDLGSNVQTPIHVFGSANVEHIILPDKAVSLGSKYDSEMKEVYGGGGLNYTARLMEMGFDAVPFLAIGKDGVGERIQEYVLKIARSNGLDESVQSFIKSESFCVPNTTTAHATIVVQDSQRTIFANGAKGLNYYKEHLKERQQLAMEMGVSDASGVIIGHLRDDEVDAAQPSGSCLTEELIDAYIGDVPVILNFGSSQLRRGYSFWKERIWGEVIYQFNLEEAKLFFSDELGNNPSLIELLRFFRERQITGIITLDRFGAVANFRDGKKGIILAWPLLDITQITDPTGAGDAFAAGVIAHLKGSRSVSFFDFFAAVEIGRNWAAYACTTYGGSADCPNTTKLDKFLGTYDFKGQEHVELLGEGTADQLINLIDMACR